MTIKSPEISSFKRKARLATAALLVSAGAVVGGVYLKFNRNYWPEEANFAVLSDRAKVVGEVLKTRKSIACQNWDCSYYTIRNPEDADIKVYGQLQNDLDALEAERYGFYNNSPQEYASIFLIVAGMLGLVVASAQRKKS